MSDPETIAIDRGAVDVARRRIERGYGSPPFSTQTLVSHALQALSYNAGWIRGRLERLRQGYFNQRRR